MASLSLQRNSRKEPMVDLVVLEPVVTYTARIKCILQ